MLAKAVRRFHSDESGSMVVALLVIIIAAGLSLAMTAYVLQGHTAVRFDRDHTRVVQGADAGIHDSLFALSQPGGIPGPYPKTQTWQGLGDYRYTWTAQPDPAGQTARWRVTSTGELNGVQRRVTAILTAPRPFKYAAFADKSITLVGSNSANSYSAGGWGTGLGAVGSNGRIYLHGSATADSAEVYNWLEDPDLTRCTSYGNTVCNTAVEHDERFDVTSDSALAFIADATDTLCPGTPSRYVASVNGALAPGEYCFSRMTFDANVTFTGTSTNPVRVFLKGESGQPTIEVSNWRNINCAGCTTTSQSKPEAGGLQIFTAAYGDVRIGNNGHFAGTLFAPRASCRGNPSNAQTHFYGSMICSVITNQGGWSFHYDTRLSDIAGGFYDITRWSEH